MEVVVVNELVVTVVIFVSTFWGNARVSDHDEISAPGPRHYIAIADMSSLNSSLSDVPAISTRLLRSSIDCLSQEGLNDIRSLRGHNKPHDPREGEWECR